MSDFTVDDHGSLILLKPESPEAFEWIAENIGAPIPWFAGGIALEPSIIPSLLCSILEDDLSFEPDSPTRH
jgi:hypothetical protein